MTNVFEYVPPQGEIPILYVDEHIVVLNKPSGLLSVPGRDPAHRDSLQTRVQERFAQATTVHRLDMDTSGIVIMALHKEAHRHLSRQFENKCCTKTYVCLVDGLVEADCGSVDLPLRCDWPNRPLQMVDHELGKKALTHWKVLERLVDRTRLELHPVTGRSHQLRVHCLSMGHPILGDRFYADEQAVTKEKRLCLHAQALRIFHPVLQDELFFECPSEF
ncbi:pseudouridine synthase [Terasakiella brassicae]|uniref:Dual-specificity RNA pseudouridine synthase RluA n=1 Tax=Terasakiella brassicae TaxID=1634917 RepID=A0A917FCG7_9PROT|nr:pseudouridine synthase [Terasakiella brassicae]GGF64844.1 pseudouridine synthase [Terasakiella brassicae]